MTDRPCTCHQDDNPPQPCPKKYALAECRAASKPAQEPDPDKVICPNCCHQFRAIPVSVQQILLNLGCEPPFMGTPEPAQEPPVAWRDALEDCHGALVYIRSVHGDLYGVGWDRCMDKAAKILAAPPADTARADRIMELRALIEEAISTAEEVARSEMSPLGDPGLRYKRADAVDAKTAMLAALEAEVRKV